MTRRDTLLRVPNNYGRAGARPSGLHTGYTHGAR